MSLAVAALPRACADDESPRPESLYPAATEGRTVAVIGEPHGGPPCHEESSPGVLPHTDHEPKHGGVFFMAPDQLHHLEGVLVRPGVFKLHLYDAYTKPLSGAAFTARLRIDAPRPTRMIKLVLDRSDGALAASLPPGIGLPVDLTVFVTFPARDRTSRHTDFFNFSFDAFSAPESAAAPAAAERTLP